MFRFRKRYYIEIRFIYGKQLMNRQLTHELGNCLYLSYIDKDNYYLELCDISKLNISTMCISNQKEVQKILKIAKDIFNTPSRMESYAQRFDSNMYITYTRQGYSLVNYNIEVKCIG